MASAAAPATTPAPATTSTAPSAPVTIPDPAASTAPTDQSAPAQPPLHPYSVYDIEKSNHVFSRIIKSAVTLLVEELCSIAPDVCNQMKTAVTPKRTMQATVQDADDIDDALPGFALTALPPDAEEAVAKAMSVDP
ncbi:hypothetical protein C0992_001359, partial [Termitomyces sp. T32_za158]